MSNPSEVCGGISHTDKLVLGADLSYKELSGRPKNLWGVHNKMQLKRQKLDSIYDLRAIRVIVRDKTDCYAVLRQVRGNFLVQSMLDTLMHHVSP